MSKETELFREEFLDAYTQLLEKYGVVLEVNDGSILAVDAVTGNSLFNVEAF
jgi:hypothetical protein